MSTTQPECKDGLMILYGQGGNVLKVPVGGDLKVYLAKGYSVTKPKAEPKPEPKAEGKK